MNEDKYANELKKFLQQNLSEYEITNKESLLYRVIVTNQMKYLPIDPLKPVRGQNAFETDILIKKNGLPLIVIETKYGGFSTHDMITYSHKSIKHKEIYPHLNYGLIIGNKENDTLDRRFFMHNSGFDFAIILELNSKKQKKLLLNIIKQQIQSAEQLSKIINGQTKVNYYNKLTETGKIAKI